MFDRLYTYWLVYSWWLSKDSIISLHLIGLSWKRLFLDQVEIYDQYDFIEIITIG